MRISISNIAWNVEDDLKIVKILNSYGIDAIDIAPGKYFSNFNQISNYEIIKVADWWRDQGIEIVGMQSLLFGTSGLNIFGSKEIQEKMYDHLYAVMKIASLMGIKRLVFGSPKNRDRSGLDDKQVLKIATDFFRRLGDFAHSVNVQICLEPNPTCYGANFMTTTNETAFVVQNINHENIKLQIDTGAIEINIEDINSLLKKYHSFVGHIHVSEPNLLPVGDLKTNHSVFSSAIRQHLPNQIVTIEMLVGKNESALTAVERAIKFVVQNYRN